MQKEATLKNIKFIRREQYNKIGLVFNFQVESIGEVSKTINIPKHTKSQRSGLGKLIRDLNLVIPDSYLDSHFLLAQTLESQLKQKNMLVKIESTGKKLYPFNIIDIRDSYINSVL